MKNKEKYFCSVSGKEIPAGRVEFLKESGIPEDRWTTIENSQVTRKKGVYVGEKHGSDGIEESGELKIVDRIYSDSVRSVLAEDVDREEE